jgi:hypothetical protein
MSKDPTDDDLYEFAPQASPPRPIPAIPIAKAATPVTLSYLAPKDEPRVIADTDTIRDFYMPLSLLAGGVVIEMVADIFFTGRPTAAVGNVAAQVVLGTSAMLGGIYLAAKFRGIQLGKFWTVVFKLAAISVAPSAVVDLISPLLQLLLIVGALVGLIVKFILYFALLGALFDLDQSDTWYCVCVIFLVDLVLFFGVSGLGIHW